MPEQTDFADYQPKIWIDPAIAADEAREVDGSGELRATDGATSYLRIVDEA